MFSVCCFGSLFVFCLVFGLVLRWALCLGCGWLGFGGVRWLLCFCCVKWCFVNSVVMILSLFIRWCYLRVVLVLVVLLFGCVVLWSDGCLYFLWCVSYLGCCDFGFWIVVGMLARLAAVLVGFLAGFGVEFLGG